MVCATSPVTVFAALLPEEPDEPEELAEDLLAEGLLAAADALLLAAGLALAAGGVVAATGVACVLNDSKKISAAAVLTIAKITRRKGKLPFVVRTRTTQRGCGAA
jgi:hypothetical protein